uniref:CUE domain-containing protein 1-like n=1 Tax=Saccoglossus kowalevskii TaxID=10224 RepID=A0ABM0MT55_SACKO|nr:PREDICTED: CUE domain-containing protein 1-like [Saccoglossus kowalevskii]
MAMAPEPQPPSTGKKKSKHRKNSSGGQPPMTNNMASPGSRQLEFTQAMKDFKTMFPKMENDVIEAVLRANNGAVDATIDQLLAMNVDMSEEEMRQATLGQDEPLPPQVFEPTSDDDEPPPAYTPHAQHSTPSTYPGVSPPSSKFILTLPTPEPVSPSPKLLFNANKYRNWNPPLLGALPDDFLRIGPSVAPGTQQPHPMVTVQLQKQLEQNRQQRSEVDNDDVELKQMLEDEQLAIMLQNEEFLSDLQRHPEFIASLERDQRAATNGSVSSQTNQFNTCAFGGSPDMAGAYGNSEDPAFKDKLLHMGKSTKKKFAQLAKRFQRKKKRSAKASYPFDDGFIIYPMYTSQIYQTKY